MDFQEAKDFHAQQSTLAAMAFLERNPKGFDSPELLKGILKHAYEKAQKQSVAEADEFKSKQLHQKPEVAKIDILKTRKWQIHREKRTRKSSADTVPRLDLHAPSSISHAPTAKLTRAGFDSHARIRNAHAPRILSHQKCEPRTRQRLARNAHGCDTRPPTRCCTRLRFARTGLYRGIIHRWRET